MDRISPEERSRIMSHIRSKDTKPENGFVPFSIGSAFVLGFTERI